MRLRYLFFLLLLGSATARAQSTTAPDWLRAQVLDCPGSATATGLLTDASGNAYLTGIFNQTLALGPGTTFAATGLQDSYLAKYAPGGGLLWGLHLAGAAYTVAHDVVSDAQGNVYVGGSFTQRMSLGGLSLNNPQGDTFLFLAKINAQGQPQWLRQLGGGNGVISSGMGLDAAGNAYFTGTFSGSMVLGSTTLVVAGPPGAVASDVFLARFDAQGQLAWARQGGHETPSGVGNYYQYAPHLLVSPAGACYLTWTSTPGAGGFGSLPLPATPGENDAVVVKYDAQGTPAWVFSEGGAGNDLANRAVLDGTGQLLVTGSYEGLASFGPATLSSTDRGGLLLALDEATGRVNWARELASTATLYGPATSGLTVDAAGNSYVAAILIGDALVDGVSFLPGGSSSRDGLVLSFTPQGRLRWGQQADGPGDELPGHLAWLPNGELLLAGDLNGTGRFGAHTVSSNPTSAQNPVAYLTNPFLARLGQLPTTTRPGQAAAPLAVYPNPVARGAALQLPPLPAGTQVVVSDALGRQVWQGPRLAVPGAPGVYIVQALAPDGRQWRSRLVVE
ncbi:hypothetical protein Q5H93_18460 [Hymenobacter sp. ASUV-10]|uniref:T9SS type A sorting domain-containing protein n=1 Tax=Hymenobacter aranciens TaxID=3063996 RepID=A0ABT9BEP0_9BACT|nr:hypothetical protein [Hymenobacter sp. ASUV-10]MDO7876734.1 hypothetical protein [Hymenobacter sp. ASUV-10]